MSPDFQATHSWEHCLRPHVKRVIWSCSGMAFLLSHVLEYLWNIFWPKRNKKNVIIKDIFDPWKPQSFLPFLFGCSFFLSSISEYYSDVLAVVIWKQQWGRGMLDFLIWLSHTLLLHFVCITTKSLIRTKPIKKTYSHVVLTPFAPLRQIFGVCFEMPSVCLSWPLPWIEQSHHVSRTVSSFLSVFITLHFKECFDFNELIYMSSD